MRLFITGVHGQLGRAMEEHCRRRGLGFAGFDLPELDITDADAVLRAVTEECPSAIVNCAAFTAVDAAEASESEALAVNGTAVGHLAAAADAVGAVLLEVSTDYVFDGNARRPYLENDRVHPASAYGRTKLRGEEEARRARRWIVARTAWLFGEGGKNFIEAIRRQVLSGREVLRVVDDQRGSPSYAADVAWALIRLLEEGFEGTVHVANSGSCTWFEMAREIVRLLGAEASVVPVATTDFPRAAPRPGFSVLDTRRLTGVIGAPLPPWQVALERYIGRTHSEAMSQ